MPIKLKGLKPNKTTFRIIFLNVSFSFTLWTKIVGDQWLILVLEAVIGFKS